MQNNLIYLKTHIADLRPQISVGCAMNESVSENQRPVTHTQLTLQKSFSSYYHTITNLKYHKNA